MYNYPWLDHYCKAFKGVTSDYKVEWTATRYMLLDKMFAMVGGDQNGKPIISLKLEPQNGMLLRETYKDIIPGYYLNKTHWNSVYLEGDVPEAILKKMLEESYTLVLQSFSKKKREAILGDIES